MIPQNKEEVDKNLEIWNSIVKKLKKALRPLVVKMHQMTSLLVIIEMMNLARNLKKMMLRMKMRAL